MGSAFLATTILALSGVLAPGFAAVPTGLRTWRATSGHEVEAKALAIARGQVRLEKADGQRLTVPLDKFVDADQALLRKHFGIADAPTPATPAGGRAREGLPPADDLPYPLGETTAEISCGDEFSYFLHLPKSLLKGQRHPVLFVMSPGGGDPRVAQRYLQGAERNRWIVAVSKQSKNGFGGSGNAVLSMIGHVKDTLPVDEGRLYLSGFSGGSRVAFMISQVEKDIAGIIACGAGGEVGSPEQVVYGLCGTNCFNRKDMAHTFKHSVKHEGSLLRYFVALHAWGGAELCDDAITHLNGVFLAANKSKYPDQLADYQARVDELIAGEKRDSPMRAHMWTQFLADQKITTPASEAAHRELAASETSVGYVEGLQKVSEFAQEHFGDSPSSTWRSDPKVSAACRKEAEKYAGLPWSEILNKMAEDAQRF